ncbi:hypothetical protein N7476_005066 [Penicillium atrosanguineum]|uniref:Rhodopsin domain-containing protein n=1 Tax=Penicillium atrosanguineum TaxID=1132637 RepID=A0A9W9Q0T8_9EURO|nr:hypothetical protein N7526_002004 [Penicillium atrosanguineum]KAJ5318646.1 hypothetical protein N7476_005066 [Penicillium atrosanguineum]
MSTDGLIAEIFSEFGLGIFFLAVRLFVRLYLGGLRGLRLSDAFAVVAMVFWTMQTVMIYLQELCGNNIGLNAKIALLVPESQIHDMILGSKLAFMNWIWYISYIWCLKGVMLCLYWEWMQKLWRRHLVTVVSALCVTTWLACLLMHVCICTPVPQNWQIKPYPGDHCTLRQPLYRVTAVLNVLTNVCLLTIPIPVFITLQITFKKKAILITMFSSGIFVIICTILRAYYSLGDITNLPIALRWASRECCIAAVIVSLPGIKPFFQKDPATFAYDGFGSQESDRNTEFEDMPWESLPGYSQENIWGSVESGDKQWHRNTSE